MKLTDAYIVIKNYMEIFDLDIQQAWVYIEEAYRKEVERETDKQG